VLGARVGARPPPASSWWRMQVGVKRHSSLLSKREETMKADSLRELGLWWLSHAPGPLPSLWNTQGKSSNSLQPRLCAAYRRGRR
jgi:hypothetical protein